MRPLPHAAGRRAPAGARAAGRGGRDGRGARADARDPARHARAAARDEVVGFQVRAAQVEDEEHPWGEEFPWDEYVLFNPYAGYRYLVHYEGHWNLVTPLDALPEPGPGGAVRFEGRRYRHFQSARAVTRVVLGEFPWVSKVGDTVETADHVDPPFLLSSESTPGETTWSLGEYVPGEEIRAAFLPRGRLPGPQGVYSNQPSPHAGRVRSMFGTGLLLVAALLLAWLAVVAIGPRQRVFSENFTLVQGQPFVTEPFDLTGGRSRVEVRTAADVSNSWVFVGYALINDETGETYDFGREVSYYSGVDGGERWSEGSREDRVLIPAVAPGRYYLRVEPELPAGAPPQPVNITVRRGVPSHLPFLLALLALFVPPAWTAYRAWAFEVKRWAESDHPMVTSE